MVSQRKLWEVAYLRDRAAGRARYVDAEPTRRRLSELAAAHVPIRTLGRATGLSGTAIHEIIHGSNTHVQRATATAVARLSLQRIYSTQSTGHVPRIGAVRRIEALMAMGWGHEAIAKAGAPGTAALLNRRGHLVTIGRWRQIKEVYDTLSMTPGPSALTRGWAKALGYAPPLAWDDDTIDDPTATPTGDRNHHIDHRDTGHNGIGHDLQDPVAIERAITEPAPVTLTDNERTSAVRAMAERAETDNQIADQLGISSRTVLRIRQRHDIDPGRPSTRDPDQRQRPAQRPRTGRELEARTPPLPATPDRRPAWTR